MMLAKGNDFIKDFAERTKQNYNRLQEGPYEVTQLINSMVGLLIIPEQRQFDAITDSLLSDELLQKMIACIKNNTYAKPINLQEICRHIRNAVAHSHIEFEAEKPNIVSDPLIIHSVVFSDENNKNEKITIRIPIELLKEFLFSFSAAIATLQ